MTTSVDLLEALRQLPIDDGCPRPGEALVVALSGGADSVTLLDLLQRWMASCDPAAPRALVAVHLDHGLRDESAADAEFCRQLCAARGIECVVERAPVESLAAASGLGVEAAGRRARYELLERVRRRREFDRIATAHHLDDHLETVLLWLGRGTGLSGLVGIEASTPDRVRPLRSFRRDHLRAYLDWRGLEWREDPSNASLDRRRNQVRSQLLPRFQEIFGRGSAERLAGFSRRATEDRRALRDAAGHLLELCRRPGPEPTLVLSREVYSTLPATLRGLVLREVLDRLRRLDPPRSQRWNEEHFRRVLDFMREARVGADLDLPEGGRLSLDRGRYTFWPASGRDWALDGPVGDGWCLSQEVLPVTSEQVTFLQQEPSEARLVRTDSPRPGAGSGAAFEAAFDADRIQGPVRLRSLLDGDRMQPLGMSGHKRIRRLLAEQEVPRHRRADQLVVEDDRRVIWAVGLATCHDARIQASTRSVLRLRVEPELSIAKQQGKDPGS